MISKKVVRSLTEKKGRDEHHLFIVQGGKSVIEVCKSDLTVEAVFCTPAFYDEHPLMKKVKAETTDARELASLGTLEKNDQALAVVHIPRKTREGHSTQIVAVEHMRDPGNLGTLIRILDWFGLDTLVLGEGSVDVYNPKVIQATMGSVMRVAVEYRPIDPYLKKMRADDYAVLGTDTEGISIAEYAAPEKFVLLLGSESHGISPDLSHFITDTLTIPKRGAAESLNVSVSAGILLDRLTNS